jgi:hypothetical protein
MKVSSMASVAALVAAQIIVTVKLAHAGVATQVPEPASLALLGAGAAVVAVGAWWKNRK